MLESEYSDLECLLALAYIWVYIYILNLGVNIDNINQDGTFLCYSLRNSLMKYIKQDVRLHKTLVMSILGQHLLKHPESPQYGCVPDSFFQQFGKVSLHTRQDKCSLNISAKPESLIHEDVCDIYF